MPKRVVTTSLGDLWLWGDADTPGDDRPLVLSISGAFSIPEPRAVTDLPGLLPEALVLNGHLPGNHCPPLIYHSIGVYARAYDEAVDAIGRPTIVFGASVGALVAFAMRSSWVRGIVAADPPLVGSKLWPLVEPFRTRLRDTPGDDGVRAFIWTVFGLDETRHEERDYRGLLDGLSVPATVLFGDQALYPQRRAPELMSLLDEPERDLLRAHPKIRVRLIEGIGHNVPGRAISFVRTAVRDLLQTALRPGEAGRPAMAMPNREVN